MKFKSTLLGQTSGSLDGTVFSRNRGGRYTRVRATPLNPNTPQQQVVRGLVGFLTSAWLNVLNPLQRAGWDTYALQVPLVDRLGEPRNVGGIAMYVRSNVPRQQQGESRIDDAPTIFNLGEFIPVTVTNLSEATQQLDVNFDPFGTDPWVSEDNAFMFIFHSRPQNASVNFFKGPYRFGTAIDGNAAVPPVPPFQPTAVFPFVAGQRVFFRVAVSRADGRYSLDQRTFDLAVA